MGKINNNSKPKENQRNYYRVLFVQPDAPMEIIQASYRTIMQKLKAHPDLGGDTWNASVINQAFETLIDPKRRIEYDNELFAEKGMRTLGLQSPIQRAAEDDELDFQATWQEFQPRAI